MVQFLFRVSFLLLCCFYFLTITHSQTHSPNHPPTHSPTHSLTYLPPPESLTLSITHNTHTFRPSVCSSTSTFSPRTISLFSSVIGIRVLNSSVGGVGSDSRYPLLIDWGSRRPLRRLSSEENDSVKRRSSVSAWSLRRRPSVDLWRSRQTYEVQYWCNVRRGNA